MKKIFLMVVGFAMVVSCLSQPVTQAAGSNLEARKDFQDRRFGLFIHWGIYSLLGDNEWVMHNQKISYNNYSRLAGFFYPFAFNAKEWVDMAKAAGMKYITITSRHHDGFSMFDTKASPYNIVKATFYQKDPLKELAEECHRQGIKLFFYYSLLDWGRPDYGFGKPIVEGRPSGADWDHYIEFMKQQLTELLTNYGPIAGIWFDGEWERRNANWHFDEIYQLIHRLQPQAMVGNNHHHDPRPGEDFQMFEKDLPGDNTTGWVSGSVSQTLPLETCETMNDNWGYTINDTNFKSVRQIVHYLVNAAGRNGNFLLNIGPMPNGKVQPEFRDTLSSVGNWLQKYGPSIYGTRGNIIAPQPWGVVTRREGKIYLHVLKAPKEDFIFIPGLSIPIQAASNFGTQQNLLFKQLKEGVFVFTNKTLTSEIDNIIELKIK